MRRDKRTDRHGQTYTRETPKPISYQVESCGCTDDGRTNGHTNMVNAVWPPLNANIHGQLCGHPCMWTDMANPVCPVQYGRPYMQTDMAKPVWPVLYGHPYMRIDRHDQPYMHSFHTLRAKKE
jgi:hypothetical protein